MSEGSKYIGLTVGEIEEQLRMDKMSDANARQVGGTHYKTGGLQHWDVVDMFDVPYLEGVGSKYPLRWRDKGGVEDLRKTLHYIDKILERPDSHRLWDRPLGLRTSLVQAASDLCEAHSVGPVERRVVMGLLQGSSRTTLVALRQELAEYIDGLELTRPGTPEDGGHHARQVEADVLGKPVAEKHLHLHLPEGCGGSLTVSGDQAHLIWGKP